MLEAHSEAKPTLLHSLEEKNAAPLWWARRAAVLQPAVRGCSLFPEKDCRSDRKVQKRCVPGRGVSTSGRSRRPPLPSPTSLRDLRLPSPRSPGTRCPPGEARGWGGGGRSSPGAERCCGALRSARRGLPPSFGRSQPKSSRKREEMSPVAASW